MIWLLLSILLSGLLIYMIFLSNEMSKICDRLLGRTKRLMKKIDKITKSGYSDVFRKNNDNTRSLLSVKEQGNTIKQIILHNSNGSNNSLLYLKGNFDADKIRKMAETDDFSKFSNALDQKY